MIEAHLRGRIHKAGGLAIKLSAASFIGVPDRLCLLPGGVVFFAELKAPGKRPTTHQEAMHARLRGLGFTVHVLDSKGAVDAICEGIG